MLHSTCHTFSKVISCIRRVKHVLIRIQIFHFNLNHWLYSILDIYKILEVPALHNKCVVIFSGKICSICLFKFRSNQLFKCLTTSLNNLFRQSSFHQNLNASVQFVPGIHELHIQKLFHGSYRILLVFTPTGAVISKEACRITVNQFILILSCKYLCLTDIREILRL